MTEEDYLYNLKKVKLILGNGFDLHCGLDTRYKDFFLYDEGMKEIDKWYKKINFNNIPYYFKSNYGNHNELGPGSIPEGASVWELFFNLMSSKLGIDNWCDIELEIFNSLRKEEKAYFNCSFWNLVYGLLTEEIGSDNLSDETLACAAYMNKKYSKNQNKTFFHNLLKELRIFESKFGNYILKQMEEHKNEYGENAGNFINQFPLDLNKIISIDSFNYTWLEKRNVPVPFRNINGNVDSPIFGIDSSKISIDDPTYIFTKTSRRIIQSMVKSNVEKLGDFDNLVIYGHSLNSQDYNFFFPIFDYLELDNASKTTNVIFAYSDHLGTTSEEIQKEQMEGISKIITTYDEYLHPDREERRLLDSLSAQGRITIHKV